MAPDKPTPLQGKRVLVTRPEAQAQPLAEAIEALGGVALYCPVLAIAPLPAHELDRQKLLDLDHYDDLVVVSANAARLTLQWVDRYWPQLPPHLRWLAVGNATARVLENAGIDVTVPPAGFNSEALLAMSEMQQMQGRRVLILKGAGGRSLLRERLGERGARIDALVLYRREPLHYSTQQLAALFVGGKPDILMATSVDVLEAMDAVLASSLAGRFDLPLVVASARIAERADTLGYRHIVTAEDPSQESIVRVLNVIA